MSGIAPSTSASAATPAEPAEVLDLPARPATRNDVARRAGVSNAVVSYVMNQGPRKVAPETARRVLEAVAALGYKPNLTARSLASGTTKTLGLIVSDLVNPFFAEFAYAIERAANEQGRTMIIGHSEANPDAERTQAQQMEARQVDGLLIASVFSPDELQAWSVERQTGLIHPPTVLFNAWRRVPGMTAIGPDFIGGTRAAVDHLLEHGHRNVALITGSPVTDPREPREEGWWQAHQAAGAEPGPIERGDYGRPSGWAAAHRLLSRPDRPTAVMAVSDLVAVGALRAAHELGLSVPEDVAIVSFDGTGETEFTWPPLTTVHQPLDEMARAAIRQVLLPPGQAGGDYQQFATELVIRRSCGCS